MPLREKTLEISFDMITFEIKKIVLAELIIW